jgi:hypothetical protein
VTVVEETSSLPPLRSQSAQRTSRLPRLPPVFRKPLSKSQKTLPTSADQVDKAQSRSADVGEANSSNSDDDVSEDSIEDLKQFNSPRYNNNSISSPVSSITESGFTSALGNEGARPRKKVWQLEPIPTRKYVPVPTAPSLR